MADSGEYLLDGLPIEQYSERELTRVRNRKIGFIFQNFQSDSADDGGGKRRASLIYQGSTDGCSAGSVYGKPLERVGLSAAGIIGRQSYPAASSSEWRLPRALVTEPSLFWSPANKCQ